MGRTTEPIIIRNFTDMIKASEGLIEQKDTRVVKTEAIIDTGATYVCLSQEHIEELGLVFHNTVNIRTANGNASRRIFKGVEIELKGRTFVMEVMENAPNTPALVGYLLLEALDLIVDPKSQQVTPNPEHDGKWVADLY